MSVIIIIVYIFSKKKYFLYVRTLKRGKAAGAMSAEKETKNPARQGLERGSVRRMSSG